jgi:hypothetical protein
MSWIGLLFLLPLAFFVAAVWMLLALLPHRREPSLMPYLFHGIRFFNPLWFKPEAHAIQRRFVLMFVCFLASIVIIAAVAIMLAART